MHGGNVRLIGHVVRIKQLHRRRGDIHHIKFTRQRLHNAAEFIETAIHNGLAQRRANELQTMGAQVIHGGHLRNLDPLTRHAFDVAQQAMLTRLGQRNRDPFPAGTTGPTDTVHIRFRIGRHIKVHHVRDVLHIQAAGRDIGGDQQVGLLRAELRHHAVALILAQTTVQRIGTQTTCHQCFTQLVHFGARTAEHNGAGRLLDVQHAGEGRHLVRARHNVGHLTHTGRFADGHHFTINGDEHRITQLPLGNAGNPWRQRGRKQCGLTRLRRGFENGLEILGEAHVQHLIGFVEHHGFQRRHLQRMPTDVIERPTGRGDHDVNTALQGADLHLHGRTTVHGQGVYAHRLAIAMHRFGHLHGEFARRHQNQGGGTLRPLGGRIHAAQQRQRKGRRFAGPGGRLGQDITSFQQRRNRGALNGGWFFVAQRCERRGNAGVESEGRESGFADVALAVPCGDVALVRLFHMSNLL